MSNRDLVSLLVVCTSARHEARWRTVTIGLVDDSFGDGVRVGFRTERTVWSSRSGKSTVTKARGISIVETPTGLWFRFKCSRCSNDWPVSKADLLSRWDALILEQKDDHGRVERGEVLLDLATLIP